MNHAKQIVLVSGPVKSGKSKFAEKLAGQFKNVKYIALNDINDNSEEWRERIKLHSRRRPKDWKTIVTSDLLTILNQAELNETLLIDSLGGFVMKYLQLDHKNWLSKSNILIDKFNDYKGNIILVSEETGWGVSPSTNLGNIFRDRLGTITNSIYTISTINWLVIHNRAIDLSKISIEI